MSLNGDHPLSAAERRAYFRNGWREILADREIGDVVQAEAHVSSPTDARSPFRAYSDAVLARTLDTLEAAPREIVDVGCGSGAYARWFKDCDATYYGVDVVRSPAWTVIEQEANGWRCTVRFHHTRGEALDALPVRADFSLSCSALEHVDDPDAVVRGLARCTVSGSYGLHVTPAPWSLALYGPHGWRRFSSCQLRALFTEAGFDVVGFYRLGGVPSWLLHLVWITGLESGRALEFMTGARIPSLLARVLGRVRCRGARTGRVLGRIYRVLLAMALRLDRHWVRMPVGYAVLVRRCGRESAA